MLLPFMLTTFCVWPISCEALKVESILTALNTGGKAWPPRTARMLSVEFFGDGQGP
ncbi:hypothetical protein ACU4GD_36815 [Cupriavidus basilensis]